MNATYYCFKTVIFSFFLFWGSVLHANPLSKEVTQKIDEKVHSLMSANNIPGMAIAITVEGAPYYYNYGVSSLAEQTAVTQHTLFEIGSISKIFTATLAAYAEEKGIVNFSKAASHYFPALEKSAFDHITLLDLAIYSAGGLPLQFPDNVTDHATMMAFYRSWKPSYKARSNRLYSNPSIGLFGYITALTMGKTFENAMQEMLHTLGLNQTFINVPQSEMAHYAYGYTADNEAIRVNPGVLDAEAYGLKTSSTDLLHFLDINLNPSLLHEKSMQNAIVMTHHGIYKASNMIQGLGWESYSYPVSQDQLILGNSSDMALKPHAISTIVMPVSANERLFNKTGATNGFGAYVVMIPTEKIGIVLLANKNYPNSERVKLAYNLLKIVLNAKNNPNPED